MQINPINFRGEDPFKKADFTSKDYKQSKEDINSFWKRLVEEKNDIFEVMYEKSVSDNREELPGYEESTGEVG